MIVIEPPKDIYLLIDRNGVSMFASLRDCILSASYFIGASGFMIVEVKPGKQSEILMRIGVEF